MASSSRTVTVEGLNETIRSLKKLGVEVSDLKDAFQRIGSQATAKIRAAAPVRSGRLLKSIRQSRRQNSVYISAGGKRAFYTPFVEYGTSLQPAQRFMRKTAQAEGPRAVEELEKEIRQIVRGLGLDG